MYKKLMFAAVLAAGLASSGADAAPVGNPEALRNSASDLTLVWHHGRAHDHHQHHRRHHHHQPKVIVVPAPHVVVPHHHHRRHHHHQRRHHHH